MNRPEVSVADLRMAEKQLSVSDLNRRRIKQTVSVPFLWEERPGIPKRNWKPGGVPVNPTGILPVKLIASVPFQWEEEPGKPLPSFSHPPPEPPLLMLEWVEKTDTPLEPPLLMLEREEKPEQLLPSWGDSNFFHSDDEQEELSEPALEAWDLQMEDDDSDSSAPSLLANRLVPTSLSNAIPAEETFMMDGHSSYFQAPSPPWEGESANLQAPSSPAWETDSSTSSYATGTTSPIGAPFLECLFPLLTPNSSFLHKVNGSPEKVFSHSFRKPKDHHMESQCSEEAGRKPFTLGDLILMSRRRSIHRKAVQMQEQNLSMEFMRKTAFGCCINIGGLGEKWKRQLQLQLKLI